jgi:pimeloyl-ACP methyl ester carboxylesterase
VIDDRLGCIDYDDSGHGPTIVFVPGSCSTGAAWRPVIAALAGRFRCVTTSLPGYGGTAERRTPIDPPMAREVEVVEEVVRRAAGPGNDPVHLVGHSFGGLVGLAVAMRRRVRLASLLIAEAPAPDVLRAYGEREHYRAFRDMTDRYFAAFQRGEPEAIAVMIDFYGGRGTFASWPARVRDYVVATTPVNILDWMSAYGFLFPPAVLLSLNMPIHVLCGSDSHPAVRRANELLSIHLRDASFSLLKGAAHFMIPTHAAELADIVTRHVAQPIGHAMPVPSM